MVMRHLPGTDARSPREARIRTISTGIFLAGIGLIWLFHLDALPWILLVMAATLLWDHVARGRFRVGVQSAIILGGLAVLWAVGALWPGIVLLIGISLILEALVRASR